MVNGMKKLNRKGFTLIELIAVIVLLSIVSVIGSYTVSSIITNSENKNYELLIKNIFTGVESYYQECKYGEFDSYYLIGDADENGKINHNDARICEQYKDGILTGDFSLYCDLNNDGTVSNDEIEDILRYYVGSATTYSVGVRGFKKMNEGNFCIVLGLVDGNYIINHNDARICEQYKDGILTDDFSPYCDLNNDGTVSNDETEDILRYYSGSTTTYDVGRSVPKYKLTLKELVDYGYIKGNGTGSDRNVLINPKDGEVIGDCKIWFKYQDGKINIEAVEPTGSCPIDYVR